MGAMTQTSASVTAAAFAMAVSWSRRIDSWARSARRPRSPSAGILLRLVVEKVERLVGAGIQRPHDHLLAGECLEQGGVVGLLLSDGRRVLGVEEEELGAEQTRHPQHPSRPRRRACRPRRGSRAAARSCRRRAAPAPPGPRVRSRELRGSPRPSERSDSVGLTVTTPVEASTMTVSPSSSDRAPCAPTTAMIDFSRARIAV